MQIPKTSHTSFKRSELIRVIRTCNPDAVNTLTRYFDGISIGAKGEKNLPPDKKWYSNIITSIQKTPDFTFFGIKIQKGIEGIGAEVEEWMTGLKDMYGKKINYELIEKPMSLKEAIENKIATNSLVQEVSPH